MLELAPRKVPTFFTSFGLNCLEKNDAQIKCFGTFDCDGITRQWDMCDGKLWTLRRGRTAKREVGFDDTNLESLLLSRSCAKQAKAELSQES